MEVTVKTWGGINNSVDPLTVGLKECVSAKNVDFDISGKFVSRRKGFSKVLSATSPHSMFADGVWCLFATGSSIKQLAKPGGTYATATIYTAPAPLNRVSYLSFNNRIYFSDGTVSRILQNGTTRSWGLAIPVTAPNVVAGTVGSLRKGSYLIGLTYVRNDGQESGMSPITRIDIPTDGGRIDLSIIPVSTDPAVVQKNIYMSHIDGGELYLVTTIQNAVTAYPLWDMVPENGSRASTMGLTAPPAGHILAHWRGRILIADGSDLCFTEPSGYELFNPASFFSFESRITMIAPVLDGIFVSTQEKTVFLRGDSPETLVYENRKMPPAIEGSMIMDSTSAIAQEHGVESAIWLTAQGFYQGLPDGKTKFHQSYIPLSAAMSSAYLRHGNGQTHYVGFIHGNVARDNAVTAMSSSIAGGYVAQ